MLIAGPAGTNGKNSTLGVASGNGGAGALTAFQRLPGGFPGGALNAAGAPLGGMDGRYPGSDGGGAEGGVIRVAPGETVYVGGGGGGGAGQYVTGYLSVTPGDTYRIIVGAGGAGGVDDTGPGGAGADGAVIVHFMPARGVEQGTVTLDAQRHFGAAGSTAQGNFFATVAATNVINVTLPVQNGQGISLQYSTYTTVLAGGGSGTITVADTLPTNTSGAITFDDTAATRPGAARGVAGLCGAPSAPLTGTGAVALAGPTHPKAAPPVAAPAMPRSGPHPTTPIGAVSWPHPCGSPAASGRRGGLPTARCHPPHLRPSSGRSRHRLPGISGVGGATHA